MKINKIFKLSLLKLSAITAAVNFWELQDVKKLIHDFFSMPFSKDKIRQCWKYLIDDVVLLVDSLNFPEDVKRTIKNYVYIIGGLILDFIHHITTNGFELDVGLKICWAPYGRIDDLKMSTEWLKKFSNENVLGNCFFGKASDYKQNDGFIEIKGMRAVENRLRRFLVDKPRPGVWRSGDAKSYVAPPKVFFGKGESIYYCYENSHLVLAARHFWRDLDIEKEKEKLAVKGARECLRKSYGYGLEWWEENPLRKLCSQESMYVQQKKNRITPVLHERNFGNKSLGIRVTLLCCFI